MMMLLTAYGGSEGALAAGRRNANQMEGRTYAVPYPDAADPNDTSRNFAKSPWLALMNAGFGMMAGTSPYAGVNIGKGPLAGTQTLENQRKESREDESVNQRARQLAQQAEFHRDEYTKMTPAQSAETEYKQSALELANLQKLYENPIDGSVLYIRNKATGKLEKYGLNGPIPLDATKQTALMRRPRELLRRLLGRLPQLTLPLHLQADRWLLNPQEMISPQPVAAQRNPRHYELHWRRGTGQDS